MRINKIIFTPFQLPFAGAFKTGAGVLSARQGVILQLVTDEGLVGLGEAAPLPEFGGGTLSDVLKELKAILPTLNDLEVKSLFDLVDSLLLKGGPGVAALCCSLDTAACDLLAQAESLKLAEWLLPGTKLDSTVEVNATVGAPETEAAVEASQRAIRQGFSCVKLKVGVMPGTKEEIARIKAVRRAIGPEARLRLDANGAWGTSQATAILQALEDAGIELVEQPVSAHAEAGMLQVQKATSIVIAADEMVTGLEAARRIITHGIARVLVIKPVVVGGLRPARRIIELAEQNGLKSIVTTSIDSGVGIAASLHLAATLPQPRLACGLATAPLLESSLVRNLPAVIDGKMVLPDRTGLGIELDEAELKAYTIPEAQ
ncbi:MAG TPA: o-succinylbenzoate synthase [Chloroflexia bacterium]|nr:o-succinylbenzoate synthase [Chloroflexia bacterium]